MRTRFEAILFSLFVVRDGDRYLLVEEAEPGGGTAWYLPAGRVKLGEDFLAAAIRETQEESGLIVEPIGILGADQVLADDGRTTKIRIVFLGEAVGGSLKSMPDEESLRAAWFHPAEIGKLALRHGEVAEWIGVTERLRDCPLPKLTCESPW